MAYAVETNRLRDAAAFAPGVLPKVRRDRHGVAIQLCVPGGDDVTDEQVGYFASKADAERALRTASFVALTGDLWRYRSAVED
jgi:hypothetical protein